MREDSWLIKFSNGLNPNRKIVKNSDFLRVCHGVKVYKDGLGDLPAIVDPIDYPSPTGIWTSDWPFPQIFVGSERNIGITRNRIWLMDGDFAPSTLMLTSVNTVHKWSIADYHDYMVACDGVSVYQRAYDTGVWTTMAGVSATCVCDLNGQLILGAANGSNHVTWSKIGEVSFVLDRMNTAGWIPMEWAGTVWDVRRLGAGVLVSGSGGVTILTPVVEPTATFAMRTLLSFGIAGRYAIGGDDNICLVVSETGRLWTIDNELRVQEIGFEDYISELSIDNIVVTYDQLAGDFFISDGTICYILSRAGMSTSNICPTGVWHYGGALVSALKIASGTGIEITTNPQDFHLRALKTVQVVEIDALGSGYSLTMTSRMSPGGSQYALADLPINTQNVCTNKLAGIEFQFAVKNSNRADKVVNGIVVRYKTTDKRFLRGRYASQTNA